jgi:hypothetical protein
MKTTPPSHDRIGRRIEADELLTDDGVELLLSAAQSAAHYRTAAARARALQATTTTPRLKQYLGEMIARYEGRAVDIEGSKGLTRSRARASSHG